ncbi:MAG: MBL fold metallo-hydrolase [Synechococcaceae cyanobacterium SM2_3_2]|nr:MBL fold metallo-hydrolase [Synechococcaceae cyanobacterium SM2_3_2]
MNRRQFTRHVLQYAGIGFGAGLGVEVLAHLGSNRLGSLSAQNLPLPPLDSPVLDSPVVDPSPSGEVGLGVSLTWLQHSCVLFEDPALRVLVNPFRAIGCTAGYAEPAIDADLVLISSRLFDEGYLQIVPGNPRVLLEAGDYRVDGIRFQGVRMAHDATTPQGNRFGTNVGWRWTQGGVDIVHLGGAAAPINREQSILLARPDLLLIPVGGGPKNYDPQGARAAIDALQPKLVIPTMYRTEAADDSCELGSLDAFLSLVGGAVQQSPGNTLLVTPQSFPPTGFAVVTFGG